MLRWLTNIVRGSSPGDNQYQNLMASHGKDILPRSRPSEIVKTHKKQKEPSLYMEPEITASILDDVDRYPHHDVLCLGN